MAYGRLDVFWPDGLFKTFSLVDNNVSVGRSSGNTIPLETTTISRYHFSIRHDGQQVWITDLESANGTFVDSEKLVPNEARALGGGEEIQIGHLRMIYHQIDEMPTQPIMPPDETTQRVEVGSPTFRIDVVAPDRPFSPGAHMAAEVAIVNMDSQTRRYVVSVEGMPSEWIRLDRPELDIPAGENAQVLINFRPVRRSDSKPGDYRVIISVAIKNEPEQKVQAELIVRILPYSGFGMALETSRLNAGDRFRLHLHNQGSAILPLAITGREPSSSDNLRFTIQPPQVSLAPGQRLVVQADVRPQKAALFGKPRQHTFDLLVRSNDASRFVAAVRGDVLERPMLPSWMPFLIGSIVVVAGLFSVLLLALVFQPAPMPVITTFQVSSTQVAQGEPLTLSWEATSVSALNVSVNGTPIVAVNPQTTSLNLDTTEFSGAIVVSLVGSSGAQLATASHDVYVYQPLGDFFFSIDPPQLVRYVVQDLTVSWSVPGAVKTRLTGLESFSTTLVETSYGPDGTITGIEGIALNPFTLTVIAEDEVGHTRQQTLDVPLINPECVPARGAVTLFAGPDTRQQVVSTVPQGAFAVVDAQDSSGSWLRVQLSGGLSGWGQRTAFACAQTFNVDDLYKELAAPTLPPAALTPSPTAPASQTPSRPSAPPRATGTPSG